MLLNYLLNYFAKGETCHKMSLHLSSKSKYWTQQRYLKLEKM